MASLLILHALSAAAWVSTSPFGDSKPFGEHTGFESGRVLSTGDPDGIWKPCGTEYMRYVCGHIFAQGAVVRSGRYAANVTVHPGDIAEDGTERAELDSGKFATMGLNVFTGWSLLLPLSMEQEDKRLVLGQWKQSGDAGGLSPPLSMRYRSGNWSIVLRLDEYAINGTQIEYVLPHFPLGTWADLIFHTRFSKGDDGVVNVWVNGTKVVTHTGQTALTAGTDVFYNKLGLYRDQSATSQTWYAFVDNYEIGHRFEDVDPTTFSKRHP